MGVWHQRGASACAVRYFLSEEMAWEAIGQIEIYKGLIALPGRLRRYLKSCLQGRMEQADRV